MIYFFDQLQLSFLKHTDSKMEIKLFNVPVVFLLVMFHKGFDFGMMMPTIMSRYFEITKSKNTAAFYFGLNTGTFALVQMISSAVIGPIYDKTKKLKPLCNAIVVVTLIAYIIYAFATTATVAIIAQSISGIFASLTVIVYAEMSTDSSKLTKFLSVGQCFDAVGTIIATVINSWALPDVSIYLGTYHITPATIAPWVCAIFTLALFIIIQVTVKNNTTQDGHDNQASKFQLKMVTCLINDYFFWLVLINQFIINIVISAFHIFTQTTFLECFNCPTKCGSMTILGSLVLRLIILVIIPYVVTHISENFLLAFIALAQVWLMMAVSLSTASAGQTSCYFVVAAGAYSYSILWSSMNLLVPAIVGKHLPEELKATGQGISQVVYALASVISHPIAGAAFIYLGPACMTLSAAVLLGIILWNLYWQRQKVCTS
ncbi:uncharacterized protein LOC130632286 [Hydractinia symbiolongicarpus]|uniref:uncharacterized protein LOC130632286 n=1 Tax=Hydractinia symbiolongicarpus TaxID=13093 RepID=UPI00255080DD|nr:uncharacterized protein LOC130632286 [Hydractinia symbiolongicarpus]